MITAILQKESKVWEALLPQARAVLVANLLYGFAYPFVSVFSNAFLWRTFKGIEPLLLYNLGFFAGMILGFYLNGFLLRTFQLVQMYLSGMAISLLAIVCLVAMAGNSMTLLPVFGLLTGTGAGFFWANKGYLQLIVTTDENRNLFMSFNEIFQTICKITAPGLIGLTIAKVERLQPGSVTLAYMVLTAMGLGLVFLAWLALRNQKIESRKVGRFIYWSFSQSWNNIRGLSFSVGILDGGLMVLPTLFILKYIGKEGSLGLIDSFSAAVAAVVVYLAGKYWGPKDRTLMMTTGSLVLATGAIFFYLAQNSFSVLLFQAGYTVANPLIHIAYGATCFMMMERTATSMKRDVYALLVDNQVFTNLGRTVGIFIIFACHRTLSEGQALSVSLLVLISFLLLTLSLMRRGYATSTFVHAQ